MDNPQDTVKQSGESDTEYVGRGVFELVYAVNRLIDAVDRQNQTLDALRDLVAVVREGNAPAQGALEPEL